MAPHPPFTTETGQRASRKRHSRGPVPDEVKQKISASKAARHAKIRAAFPILLVGWKVCTRCHVRKHYDFSNLPDTFASDYSPIKSTNIDGSVNIRPASRCKSCQAEIKAEKYAELSPEERRQVWKKADDQRAIEKRKEYARRYDEKKRREAGIPPRKFKDGRNRQPIILVDAAPLREFLQKHSQSIPELALLTGIDDKKLWKLRKGDQKSIELRNVEKILVYFDCPHLLVLWYPEPNDEPQIEERQNGGTSL